MGADYIEQDVVLSKDNRPIVLHDIHLDTVTNVAEVFPSRSRPDGRYYAIDLTIGEIKQLCVTERIDLKTGKAAFPGRFPFGKSRFEVPTLAEEIELIQGLNKSTGRDVGIYVEVKSPAWHRGEGKDISKIVVDLLREYGYEDDQDKVYVQCFDAAETKRLRVELGTRLKLIQLIGENSWDETLTDYDKLRTAEGLREIATYANGIGPRMAHICKGLDQHGKPQLTLLVEQAHAHGLQVHPYTFRRDSLPDYATTSAEVLRIFLGAAAVDGVFTDHPDQVVSFLQRPSPSCP